MNLSVMIDCSRNAVFNVKTIKKVIDYISDMGYKSLLLYTEDVYEIEGEPYFGRFRGRYTKEEIKDIDNYCISKGIELIPCIQTLAHLNGIFRWNKYQKINDINDILLIDDEKTYELIDKMFSSLCKMFSSRKLHIGFDEAHNVGKGKYLDKTGKLDRYDALIRHLNKVTEMAKNYGFTCKMWSDMFFRYAHNGLYQYKNLDINKLKDIASKIDKDVEQVFWSYYVSDPKYNNEMLKIHKEIFNKVSFAGGTLCWFGFAPMNGINITVMDNAIEAIRHNNIEDVMVTCWFDSGAECSIYSTLPSLYYYAEKLLNNSSFEEIKSGFKNKFNIGFDEMLLLDLPNDVNNIDPIYHTNPSFYQFYADYFSGSFDYTVRKEGKEMYLKHVETLNKYASHNEFGYIYEYLAKLCEIMSYKYDLGIKTREAYHNNDNETLISLANNEYTKICFLLEEFITMMNKFWIKEHKTSGIEIFNLRIGGLLTRTKTCIELIKEHVNNGLDIVELNEDTLNFYCGAVPDDEPVCSSQYDLSASVNVYSH